MRHSALRIICSAYPLYSLEKLVEILGFDSEGEAQSFLDSIGIEMDQADENYISARGWREAFSRMGAIDTLPVGTCRWIQNKVGNTTLPEVSKKFVYFVNSTIIRFSISSQNIVMP